MTTYHLTNIYNDIDGYNKLLQFYSEHSEDVFETIELNISVWFDANLSAVLGAILDKIINCGLNSVEFKSISESIKKR